MECWRDNLSAANANTALGSRFRSADVTWTFPSAFLAGSTPVVTASVDFVGVVALIVTITALGIT